MSVETPASRWGSRRRAWQVSLAGLAVLMVWAGCNVTNENYSLLSFFFDGVPDPNAPALPDGTTDINLIRQSPTYTIHPPFAEEKCVDCHGKRFATQGVDASVCLKCHENIPSSQPRMHGPVVALACLWCHAPHESPYAALFKGQPRQVCAECHGPDMLGTDTVPEHLPEATESCLDCHFGHGGVSRYFLRDQHDGVVSPPPGAVSPHEGVIEKQAVEELDQTPVETEPGS